MLVVQALVVLVVPVLVLVVLVLLLVAVVACGLGGCGGDDDASESIGEGKGSCALEVFESRERGEHAADGEVEDEDQ